MIARSLFWHTYAPRGTWAARGTHQTSTSSPLTLKRLIRRDTKDSSRRRRNLCEVSAGWRWQLASRRHLLQISCQTGLFFLSVQGDGSYGEWHRDRREGFHKFTSVCLQAVSRPVSNMVSRLLAFSMRFCFVKKYHLENVYFCTVQNTTLHLWHCKSVLLRILATQPGWPYS
jgi:hypothetical protein